MGCAGGLDGTYHVLQVILFFDNDNVEATNSALAELESIESSHTDFTFLKVDISGGSNARKAAKVNHND